MTNNIILIVEDDLDDRELLDDAMKQENPALNLVFVENGVEALAYLERVEQQPGALPCLIVLDLNLPFIDGIETYRRIQQHALFQKVPVVVFTSSMNPADRLFFESLGVQFITKPDHFSVLHQAVIQMLQSCRTNQVS